MAAVKALQQWCRVQCDGYRDVAVTNMTTSFRDGLAFCAIIHKHRPDLIDFDSLKKENIYENNNLAFKVAEEQLGIPALLDAEDMVALKVPDRLSILTYVSQYYNYFHGRSPIGGVAAVKRPADPPAGGPSGKKNAPVVSKVFKPAKENNPPVTPNVTTPVPNPRQPRSTTQDVSALKTHQTGTLSNKCASCNNHVHLVQRYLVDGKLYHRNCAKLLSPPNASSLLRDTPSRVPPSVGLTKSDTVTPVAPSRLGPSLPVQNPSPPSSTSGKSLSPHRPALNLTTPAAGNPTAPVAKRPVSHDTTITPPATKPVAAPRTSTTAAKTVQSKLKFFQAESDDTKPATKTADPVSKGFKSAEAIKQTQGDHERSKVQIGEDKASPKKHGDSQGSNIGNGIVKVQLKENFDKSKADTKKYGVIEGGKQKAMDTPKKPNKEGNGIVKVELKENFDKSKADTKKLGVIEGGKQKATDTPKKPNKEESKNSMPTPKSDPSKNSDAASWFRSWRKEPESGRKEPESGRKEPESGRKEPESARKETESGRKETESGRGRLRLKVNPSIFSDLKPPRSDPSPIRSRTPERGLNPVPHNTSETETPADWRSMLKPVSKDSKSADSSQTSPKVPTNNTSQLSEVLRKPVNPPSSQGVRSGQNWPRSTTTSGNKVVKTRPDYIPKEAILKELKEIEDNLNLLEKRGVVLEAKLRNSEDEGEDDSLMDELMVEWFTLIRNKQVAMRRESELVYIGKTQDLEEEQPSVEQELRKLIEKPDHLKTPFERKREEELMSKLMEIINDRNAIVEGLDEDRLREEEEDEELNKLLENYSVKKDKSKKKSSISKLFTWGNKKEV
ncbi:protein-methionine sulfoxide oxidase mical2b [Corythoichthys intestinalis]|uniref:protein-methionine sulfoxide oxidase mical2b n=1 Tax=Corythoichthys intestinalis TaxID=161448 RepID=UPI0025A52376|nr:protein-methionine sulfoxide oxidase mical2b [Corythoichthys intestinalis]